MSIEVDAVGLRIFAEFKAAAKDVWDKWSPDVRQLAEDCAMDAGKLAIAALGGKDVSAERKHINAQLANLKVAEQLKASAALWEIAGRIISTALAAMIG